MTRRPSRPAGRATDREVGVVAAVLATRSEKAAAHRLGLSHSTVKHHLASGRSRVDAETTAQLVCILAARLPEPEVGRALIEPPRARVASADEICGHYVPQPATSAGSHNRNRGHGAPCICACKVPC